MRPATRSSSHGRRMPPSGAGAGMARERSRDREAPSAPSTSRSYGRPRSAQPWPSGHGAATAGAPLPSHRSAAGAPPMPASSRGGGRDEAADKMLRLMREQCLELKEAANASAHEKKLLSTRLMAMDRELQRRERLLRTMMQLQNAGQGLGMDLIEKLREERNMLPIHRRKLQDVHALVEEKEADINSLKHDEKFTRVIELQVEYASWQHEIRRLQNLLQEDGSDGTEAAQKEVDVHTNRVEALRAQLEEEERKQDALLEDLKTVQENHDYAVQEFEWKKEELDTEQEATRKVAANFKELLQERQEVEKLEDEIEDLSLAHGRLSQELRAASEKSDELRAKIPPPADPQQIVSEDKLRGPPLKASVPPAALRALQQTLAAGGGGGGGEAPLLAGCLALDVQRTGLLPGDQFASLLESAALGCDRSQNAAAACAEDLRTFCGDRETPGAVRWLDCLVALDRVGRSTAAASGPPVPQDVLPPVRPLRAACLRANCSMETFRTRLLECSTCADAEAFFVGLGLREGAASAWRDAWANFGRQGLLARLPLGDVSPPQAALDAWLERCREAVQKEAKDLEAFFDKFLERKMTEEQFGQVCVEVLAAELSIDDMVDLGLWAGASGSAGDGLPEVDGSAVLRLPGGAA